MVLVEFVVVVVVVLTAGAGRPLTPVMGKPGAPRNQVRSQQRIGRVSGEAPVYGWYTTTEYGRLSCKQGAMLSVSSASVTMLVFISLTSAVRASITSLVFPSLTSALVLSIISRPSGADIARRPIIRCRKLLGRWDATWAVQNLTPSLYHAIRSFKAAKSNGSRRKEQAFFGDLRSFIEREGQRNLPGVGTDFDNGYKRLTTVKGGVNKVPQCTSKDHQRFHSAFRQVFV